MKKLILTSIFTSMALFACPGVDSCPMNKNVEIKNSKHELSLNEMKMFQSKKITYKMALLNLEQECIDSASSIEELKICNFNEKKYSHKKSKNINKDLKTEIKPAKEIITKLEPVSLKTETIEITPPKPYKGCSAHEKIKMNEHNANTNNPKPYSCPKHK